MARGRRATPAEVKALKGNPGKRRLATLQGGGKVAARPKTLMVDPPEYLTQERERDAFRMALETLPANVARKSDIHSIARWATWLNVWVTAKLALDGKKHWYESESKHGKFLREHPLAKRMSQAESHLVSLEDRNGLNIVARNNIVHRLFQMPGAPVGGLFGDEEPKDERVEEPHVDAPEPGIISPLDFVSQAGKQHRSLN